MFNCEFCPVTTPARQPINKIVTENRPKTYLVVHKEGKKKGKTEEITGWEIVVEKLACPDCYEKRTGLTPARELKPTRRRFIEERHKWKPKKRFKPSQKNSKTKQKTQPLPQTKKGPIVERVSRFKK